jgi:hypothetical protein
VKNKFGEAPDIIHTGGGGGKRDLALMNWLQGSTGKTSLGGKDS